MKPVLIVCCLVSMAPLVWADEAPFTYNEHGKHDPFLPLVSSSGVIITYDSDLTTNDMQLEGIVADAKGDNIAIINGKVVKAQDVLGVYTVDKIADDHVDMLKGSERFTLNLKKGKL